MTFLSNGDILYFKNHADQKQHGPRRNNWVKTIQLPNLKIQDKLVPIATRRCTKITQNIPNTNAIQLKNQTIEMRATQLEKTQTNDTITDQVSIYTSKTNLKDKKPVNSPTQNTFLPSTPYRPIGAEKLDTSERNLARYGSNSPTPSTSIGTDDIVPTKIDIRSTNIGKQQESDEFLPFQLIHHQQDPNFRKNPEKTTIPITLHHSQKIQQPLPEAHQTPTQRFGSRKSTHFDAQVPKDPINNIRYTTSSEFSPSSGHTNQHKVDITKHPITLPILNSSHRIGSSPSKHAEVQIPKHQTTKNARFPNSNGSPTPSGTTNPNRNTNNIPHFLPTQPITSSSHTSNFNPLTQFEVQVLHHQPNNIARSPKSNELPPLFDSTNQYNSNRNISHITLPHSLTNSNKSKTNVNPRDTATDLNQIEDTITGIGQHSHQLPHSPHALDDITLKENTSVTVQKLNHRPKSDNNQKLHQRKKYIPTTSTVLKRIENFSNKKYHISINGRYPKSAVKSSSTITQQSPANNGIINIYKDFITQCNSQNPLKRSVTLGTKYNFNTTFSIQPEGLKHTITKTSIPTSQPTYHTTRNPFAYNTKRPKHFGKQYNQPDNIKQKYRETLEHRYNTQLSNNTPNHLTIRNPRTPKLDHTLRGSYITVHTQPKIIPAIEHTKISRINQHLSDTEKFYTNYYTPISETNINQEKNMTQVDKINTHPHEPTTVTPVRTTFQDVIRINTYTPPPVPNTNGEWTLVNPPRELLEPPKQDKHQDFPRMFPTTVGEKLTLNIDEVNMVHSGMTVSIKLSHNMNIDPKKLIKAMLASMQTVDAWAGFRPIDMGKVRDNKVLRTNSDVDEITTYQYYLDTPLRKNLSKEYTVRFKTETSLQLHHIINQPLVREWYNIERVTVEINNLETAYLSNVGFLQHANPTAEHLPIYQARLEKAMGNHSPNFEMAIKTIYPERAHTSRFKSEKFLKAQVIMVRASENDVFTLTKAFQQLQEPQEFTFFPWMEYVTLTAAQKRTIVITQEKFIQNHRSVMINLFTQDANATPLYSDDDILGNMDDNLEQNTIFENMDLRHTTVHTFIANHYKAGDGTPLFCYVYNVIGDTIEALVRRAYHAEAKECILNIHKDLMYYSNQTTKEKIFHPSLLNINMDGYTPWKPFQWKNYVPPTDGIPQEAPVKYNQRNENNNNKRTRTNNTTPTKGHQITHLSLPPQTQGTYAIVTANSLSPPSDITTMTKTMSTNSHSWNNIQNEVENIQKKYEDMQITQKAQQRSMLEMEQRLEQSIDRKLVEYNTTTQSNITALLAEAEEKTNTKQTALFDDIAKMISRTVQDSFAVSMAQYEAHKTLTGATDIEMMDTSGTDILPQKRGDIPIEAHKQKSKSNTGATSTKTIDWKQRKLG